MDAQAHQTARNMETARASGREQFNRSIGSGRISREEQRAEFEERERRASAWEVQHFLELHT